MTVPSDAELDAMLADATHPHTCYCDEHVRTLVAAVRALRAESAKLTDIISVAVFEPREPLTWTQTPPGPELHRKQCRICYHTDNERDWAYWDDHGQVWVIARCGALNPVFVRAWAGPYAEPGE